MFNFEIERGQARHNIPISTFQEINARNDRATTRNSRSNDISQASTQIRDRDIAIGRRKRRRTHNNRAMLVVLVFEATGRTAQTMRRHLRSGSQCIQRLQIPEAVLINGLVDNRNAIGLRQQNGEWLLPIRREAGIHIGLDNSRTQLFLTKETNTIWPGKLNATTDLLIIGEKISERIGPNALNHDISIR